MTFRNFALSITLMIFTSALGAQNTNTGLSYNSFGVSDATLFDRLLREVPGVGRTKTNSLIQKQNIKSYMMPVRSVKSYENGLAYSIAACLEYYVNIDRNYKVNLSPEYMSLNLKNAGRQFSARNAFDLLAQDGTVSAAILPYGSTQLTSGVYATQKYKINNYLHLFREVTKGRQRVFETRNALLKGHPVLVELKVDESFSNSLGKTFWLPKGKGNQNYTALVVGYDEITEAFEVSTCMGNGWGDNGYIWIRYSDFETHAENGYVILYDF